MNMKFKTESYILIIFSIGIYAITYIGITVKYAKNIEYLNNKLDSLLVNNNNYSYSHITTFENKTPEEGIDEALIYYGIEHPTIVKAQAILQTLVRVRVMTDFMDCLVSL